MLITEGQACAHHDIIKHSPGLIYLRTVTSLVLSAEKQRTEKVMGSSRLAKHKIDAEEENTDGSFANDVRNVLVTGGPEIWSGTLLSLCPFQNVENINSKSGRRGKIETKLWANI